MQCIIVGLDPELKTFRHGHATTNLLNLGWEENRTPGLRGSSMLPAIPTCPLVSVLAKNKNGLKIAIKLFSKRH